MKISEYLKMAGEMVLMGIMAVIGFATWIAIGLFIYCWIT